MSAQSTRTFVLELLARKEPLPARFDENADFLADGIVDSIGVIKFILEIEARFGIEMSDQEIESAEFRSVSGLCRLIERKIGHLSKVRSASA